MKKETINTFLKGMVKDLHPLTTPNDILTDALNATIVTYNGNEGVLQNDMGNVAVQLALLKAGYVPVGMKEHGGIIYVAAYNPETKKGQVGSFPSPQQLWEDENWSVNAPTDIIPTATISPNFYDGEFIINETMKLPLFTTSDGSARVFHPGDKFIINYASKSTLKTYVDSGYISVLLGVVKSDGGIEIIKTWSKDTPEEDFIYGETVGDLKQKLSDPSIVQVFSASSSGEMILIINLITYDSFSIMRDYSMEGNNIKVTFTGEATRDNKVFYSTDSSTDLRLSTHNKVDKKYLDIEGETGIEEITIYPNTPFGKVQRMGKKFKINFDKIKSNQEQFSEWRFFVTETYVKIGWAYDFYNLDKNKEIDYIRMYFHLLLDGYDRTKACQVDFLRESYNGNFEDYINYRDIGLKYKNVYIVEIVRKFKKSISDETEPDKEIIGFKMLYLSELYNDKYNGFYTDNSIGGSVSDNDEVIEFTPMNNGTARFSPNCTLECTLEESKTVLTHPSGDTSVTDSPIETSKINSSQYATPISAINKTVLDENPENYKYITKVKNKYKNKVHLSGLLIDIDANYIGVPKSDTISTLLKRYNKLTVTFDNSEVKWISSTDLPAIFDNTSPEAIDGTPNSAITMSYNDGEMQSDNFTFNDYRTIEGRASDIQTSSYETKGLQPLYSPSYTGLLKNKIAPYWSLDLMTCIAGAGENENGIFYNSHLTRSGTLREGPDSGGGFDDGGLLTASNYMDNPMTNLFTGTRGEEAELEFDNSSRWPTADTSNLTLYESYGIHNADDVPWYGWNFLNEGDENGGVYLDYQGPNFLIACWKFTNGETHFVNLISPRKCNVETIKDEDYASSKTKWPRLDVVMRCLLSLIFVVNRITKSANYITTDNRYYRYSYGTSKITITLSSSSSDDIVVSDIMTNDVSSTKTLIEYLKDDWQWGDHNGIEGIEINNKVYPLLNLIPEVSAIGKPIITETIEIPGYWDLDILLSNYYGITYRAVDTESEALDINKIYGIDTSENIFNKNACVNQDVAVLGPVANKDGAYEWSSTPKCIPLSEDNKDLTIYRWNTWQKTVTFDNFYNNFQTRAELDGWNDVPEGEFNEIYAKESGKKSRGHWTNADDEDAPDMWFDVLFSKQISPLVPDEFPNFFQS